MTDEVERAKMPFRERMRAMFNQDRLSISANDIGTLLVYKASDRLSYDVILCNTEPTELFNEVVSPQNDATLFFRFYTSLRLVNPQNSTTRRL
jgi:hypothetical protein